MDILFLIVMLISMLVVVALDTAQKRRQDQAEHNH